MTDDTSTGGGSSTFSSLAGLLAWDKHKHETDGTYNMCVNDDDFNHHEYTSPYLMQKRLKEEKDWKQLKSNLSVVPSSSSSSSSLLSEQPLKILSSKPLSTMLKTMDQQVQHIGLPSNAADGADASKKTKGSGGSGSSSDTDNTTPLELYAIGAVFDHLYKGGSPSAILEVYKKEVNKPSTELLELYLCGGNDYRQAITGPSGSSAAAAAAGHRRHHNYTKNLLDAIVEDDHQTLFTNEEDNDSGTIQTMQTNSVIGNSVYYNNDTDDDGTYDSTYFSTEVARPTTHGDAGRRNIKNGSILKLALPSNRTGRPAEEDETASRPFDEYTVEKLNLPASNKSLSRDITSRLGSESALSVPSVWAGVVTTPEKNSSSTTTNETTTKNKNKKDLDDSDDSLDRILNSGTPNKTSKKNHTSDTGTITTTGTVTVDSGDVVADATMGRTWKLWLDVLVSASGTANSATTMVAPSTITPTSPSRRSTGALPLSQELESLVRMVRDAIAHDTKDKTDLIQSAFLRTYNTNLNTFQQLFQNTNTQNGTVEKEQEEDEHQQLTEQEKDKMKVQREGEQQQVQQKQKSKKMNSLAARMQIMTYKKPTSCFAVSEHRQKQPTSSVPSSASPVRNIVSTTNSSSSSVSAGLSSTELHVIVPRSDQHTRQQDQEVYISPPSSPQKKGVPSPNTNMHPSSRFGSLSGDDDRIPGTPNIVSPTSRDSAAPGSPFVARNSFSHRGRSYCDADAVDFPSTSPAALLSNRHSDNNNTLLRPPESIQVPMSLLTPTNNNGSHTIPTPTPSLTCESSVLSPSTTVDDELSSSQYSSSSKLRHRHHPRSFLLPLRFRKSKSMTSQSYSTIIEDDTNDEKEVLLTNDPKISHHNNVGGVVTSPSTILTATEFASTDDEEHALAVTSLDKQDSNEHHNGLRLPPLPLQEGLSVALSVTGDATIINDINESNESGSCKKNKGKKTKKDDITKAAASIINACKGISFSSTNTSKTGRKLISSFRRKSANKNNTGSSSIEQVSPISSSVLYSYDSSIEIGSNQDKNNNMDGKNDGATSTVHKNNSSNIEYADCDATVSSNEGGAGSPISRPSPQNQEQEEPKRSVDSDRNPSDRTAKRDIEYADCDATVSSNEGGAGSPISRPSPQNQEQEEPKRSVDSDRNPSDRTAKRDIEYADCDATVSSSEGGAGSPTSRPWPKNQEQEEQKQSVGSGTAERDKEDGTHIYLRRPTVLYGPGDDNHNDGFELQDVEVVQLQI